MIFEEEILYFFYRGIYNLVIVSEFFENLWRYFWYILFFFCFYMLITWVYSLTLEIHRISIFYFCCDDFFLLFIHTFTGIDIFDRIIEIFYEFFICLEYIIRLYFSAFYHAIHIGIKIEKVSCLEVRIIKFADIHDRIPLSMEHRSSFFYTCSCERECEFLISFCTGSLVLHSILSDKIEWSWFERIYFFFFELICYFYKKTLKWWII